VVILLHRSSNSAVPLTVQTNFVAMANNLV